MSSCSSFYHIISQVTITECQFGDNMFINKAEDGSNNLCGKNVARFRKQIGLSQRELAVLLQINGLDLDKNAIQRIECGKRFVTDIELCITSRTLQKTLSDLIGNEYD